MEKKLMILLVTILSATTLIGQTDLQWLVSKGYGKRGTTSSTTNNYTYPFDPNVSFNLENIKHPDTTAYEFNKNDIFIIYEGGSHFNSRIKEPIEADPGFFYNADVSVVNHYFTPGLSTSKILYMYLTNIYEGDDPPGTVKTKPGSRSSGSDAFAVPAASTTTSVPEIFADHDVVRNKDITLILNNDKIKTAAGVALSSPFEYYLHFNTVVDIDDPATTFSGAFFSPNPIFPKTSGSTVVDVAIFPTNCGSYLSGTNTVKISLPTGTFPFTYVNLRPNSSLAEYYPGDDGAPAFEAVFSATNSEGSGGTTYASMTEKIRDSHDPNIIRIDSIGKDSMNDYIVFCHMECENTSETSPSHVAFTFNLPPSASSTCFEILNWYIGGSTLPGDVTRDGSKVRCQFNMLEVSSFIKCDPPDKLLCTGYINFTYKIKSTVNVDLQSTNIWVTSPTVIFDKKKYPIRKYEDLLDIRYTGQNSSTAEYYRPIISTHLCSTICSRI